MARIVLIFACIVSVLAVVSSVDIPLNRDNVYETNINVPNTEDNVESERREYAYTTPMTAADVLKRVYFDCVQRGSFACVKPKVLAFLSASMKKEHLQLTEDLVIEKTGDYTADKTKWHKGMRAEEIFEKVDHFIANHELKLRMPKEIASGELVSLVPQFLLKNIPSELRIPLGDAKKDESERSFVKKIAIPFLFGLKFNATALIPLALALIALKTWKALTLGLLSIVLSGAILLFKYSKPKLNYEVLHYPPPIPHHNIHPIVEQPQYDQYPQQPHNQYGHHQERRRAIDAQEIAYRGQRK